MDRASIVDDGNHFSRVGVRSDEDVWGVDSVICELSCGGENGRRNNWNVPALKEVSIEFFNERFERRGFGFVRGEKAAD